MDIINRCSNAAVQRCFRKRYSENMQQIYLGKGVLKICSKSTGEYPCQSVISCKGTLLKSHFGMGVLL